MHSRCHTRKKEGRVVRTDEMDGGMSVYVGIWAEGVGAQTWRGANTNAMGVQRETVKSQRASDTDGNYNGR